MLPLPAYEYAKAVWSAYWKFNLICRTIDSQQTELHFVSASFPALNT